MIIDLHAHSFPLSDDSFLTPDELVEETKRAGLDGLCISEHDQFWDPSAIEELSRRHDFPVFPAAEINTDDGHFLVYGLDRYVFGMHKTHVLRQMVTAARGAMVVAHPYRRRFNHHDAMHGHYERLIHNVLRSDMLDHVDALEALNGRGNAEENAFALDLAARKGLPCTGASDAHRRSEIGTYATRFSRRIETLNDLITELRSGRFAPVVVPPRAATQREGGQAMTGHGVVR